MLTINDRDFQRLVTFVHQHYGIDLSKKRQLIVGRLSNSIMSMGFSSFEEYIDNLINNKKPEDLELMLNKLTTNYTFFMRESSHFEFFKDTILPYLVETKKDKVLSIWSAACSSGEEPYTISMILKEFFGAKAAAWDTRVLATDISQNALVAAKNAVYDKDSLKELSPTWRSKYFRPAGEPDTFTVFCRNVMIYFDQPTKEALVQRFYNATNPGGYLLIGHSESLNKSTTPYEYLKPATYRKM